MSWYCASGTECVSPHTDGKGGHTLTDWLEIELAKTFANMFGVPFENSEAHKGDPPPHGLCGYCWFDLNGPFPIHMSPVTIPTRKVSP